MVAVNLADGARPSDRRVEEWQSLSDAASSRLGKAVVSTRSSPKPYNVGGIGQFEFKWRANNNQRVSQFVRCWAGSASSAIASRNTVNTVNTVNMECWLPRDKVMAGTWIEFCSIHGMVPNNRQARWPTEQY